jgi:16S rRNA (guanine1207-N2)-methyltransferase
MAEDHYFSANPEAAGRQIPVTFEALGETFEVTAASGTFSSSKLDAGTQFLLSKLALRPERGEALDIGCGWGPIALSLARFSPNTRVWALDVNNRSLEATSRNAQRLGLENLRAVSAEEIPADLKFDAIWSNPPIRIGKQALHALLSAWLPRLAPGGRAMLVVHKHLGSDSLQRWLAETFTQFKVTRLDSSKGYRIISVES